MFGKSLVRTLLLSAAFSLTVVGGVVWYRKQASPPSPAPPATRPPPAQSASSNPSPSVAQEGAPLQVVTLHPPYRILDGLTLRSGERTIRLADLKGPAREAICLDDKEQPWACGLRARVAINNLVAERPLVCKVVGQQSGAETAHCQIDQADLGRTLVAAGWARPFQEQQATYGSEVKAASEARAGLWNGSWRIRGSSNRP